MYRAAAEAKIGEGRTFPLESGAELTGAGIGEMSKDDIRCSRALVESCGEGLRYDPRVLSRAGERDEHLVT